MAALSNFYPHVRCVDVLEGTALEELQERLISSVVAEPEKTFLFYSYEPQALASVLDTILALKKYHHRIIWVFPESFYWKDKDTITSTGIDFYFLELDAVFLWFELNVYQSSIPNAEWKHDTGKFLFFTGKPHMSNRLKFLYHLSCNGLLDRCVWSLFMDENLKIKARGALKDLTDDEYNRFISEHVRNPEAIQPLHGQGTWHYDGYPFSSRLYAQTSFRVIAETQMFQQPIITEKTWTTIINRHPFIMVGYSGCLEYLEYLGFKTFRQYLACPDYDSVADEDQRFWQVIENIKHWSNNIQNFWPLIKADIEHNYMLLHDFMSQEINKLKEVQRKAEITGYELFRLIPGPIQRSHWINFYYGIKDPNWPDCFSEHQFTGLPVEIQKECIETFGYQPKTMS